MADISLQITADNAPLLAALAGAREAVTDATASMKSSIEGVSHVFELVNKAFVLFTAVLGGGRVFKEAVDATVNLTRESIVLGRQFGISATEASDLKVALDTVHVTQDQFAMAGNSMTRVLRTNADAFTLAGIATRDNQGALRNSLDIMLDVNRHLTSLKEGTARNVEGMRLYGRSWGDIAPVIKLNAEVMQEARIRAEELGLEVGTKDVAAVTKYRAALVGVHEVIEGVSKAIGDQLLPALTETGEQFASIGTTIITVVKYVIASIVTVFEIFRNAAEVIFDTIWALVRQFWALFSAFANSIERLLHLDWKGAKAAWKTGFDELAKIGQDAYARMLASSTLAQKRMVDAFANAAGAPQLDNKPIPRPSGGGDAGTADSKTSRIPQFKLELEQRKATFAEENAAHGQFLEFSKHAELAYWESVAQRVKLSKEERIGVESEVARLRVAIAKDGFEGQLAGLKEEEAAFKNNLDAKLAIARQYALKVALAYGAESKEAKAAAKEVVSIEREKAEQLLAIEQERLKIGHDMAMADVDNEETAAHARVAMGIETNAQLLAQERDFENRRFAIQLAALQEQLALEMRNPDRNPIAIAKLNAQIEQLEVKHRTRLNQITAQSAIEQNRYYTSMFASMNSGFSSVINNFLKGTASLKTTVRGLFAAVADAITQTLAQMAADWIVNMITTMIVGKTTAASQISSNAAVYATAAMGSVAAIPFVGWAMAPEVGAAAFALAEGYNTALSAESGFSVPPGVNPLVQLHQREMVLPAAESDAVRKMAHTGEDKDERPQAMPAVHIHGKRNDVFTADQLTAMLKQLGHRFVLS